MITPLAIEMSTPLAITAGSACFALIVTVAATLLLVRLFGRFTRQIKQLKEVNAVLQGQVTAIATIMTNVINGLDDAPRNVISNTFKTFLGKRASVNLPPLSEEDKNTFNQAYNMTVLAIIEEIKPPLEITCQRGPQGLSTRASIMTRTLIVLIEFRNLMRTVKSQARTLRAMSTRRLASSQVLRGANFREDLALQNRP